VYRLGAPLNLKNGQWPVVANSLKDEQIKGGVEAIGIEFVHSLIIVWIEATSTPPVTTRRPTHPIFSPTGNRFLDPYNESEETKGRILPFSLFLADLSLWDITKNLRPVPLAVIFILIFFSLLSWTIVLSKSGIFSRARSRNRNFLRAFRKAKNLQAIAAASEQFGSAPLVAVFDFGYREIERQISQRGALVNKPAVERSLQLGISEEVTKLEMNMPWLATVASVSPFIGLFGTVWGIIDAFEGLGTAGSASLRAVAPGISEALVTTAIGLAAAIPAAIFYNLFGSRIREFGTRMEDFAIEFQNFAERDFGG
jgi:biopolymer transport protein TolQ